MKHLFSLIWACVVRGLLNLLPCAPPQTHRWLPFSSEQKTGQVASGPWAFRLGITHPYSGSAPGVWVSSFVPGSLQDSFTWGSGVLWAQSLKTWIITVLAQPMSSHLTSLDLSFLSCKININRSYQGLVKLPEDRKICESAVFHFNLWSTAQVGGMDVQDLGIEVLLHTSWVWLYLSEEADGLESLVGLMVMLIWLPWGVFSSYMTSPHPPQNKQCAPSV